MANIYMSDYDGADARITVTRASTSRPTGRPIEIARLLLVSTAYQDIIVAYLEK